MKLETIKKELESDKSFQYWNEAIGLSFDDFSIYELKEDEKTIVLKNGNDKIGTYSIYLKNGAIDSFCFDTRNEAMRDYRLKTLGINQ